MRARFLSFVATATILVFISGCATTPDPVTPTAHVVDSPSAQVAERSKPRAKKERRGKQPAPTPEESPSPIPGPNTTPSPTPESATPTPSDSTPDNIPDNIPIETLDLPPEQLDPLPPEENPDPPLEPEDIAVQLPTGALALDHGILQIAFSTKQKIALYAKYELTAADLRARFIHRDANPFTPDPLLLSAAPEAAATHATYTRSGYDRGHLAPAEDMSFNADAFFASFYMSNMAPQKGRLNQQSWKSLEERARDWACGEERVTIITGPLLGAKPKLLKNRVPIPEAFYKVIVDHTPPRKIAAFIYEQNTPSGTLPLRQQVSPRQVEKRAGFALFRKASARITPLSQWKSARCPEMKTQVSAKKLARERKAAPRLGHGEE